MASDKKALFPWKSILGNTGLLAVATAFSALAQFILVWYIARSKGSAFLGAYGVVQALVDLLYILLGTGIQPLVMREVAREAVPNHRFVGTTLVASSSLGACGALVLVIWPFVLDYPLDTRYALLIACLMLIPNALRLVGEYVAIALERTVYVTIIQLAEGVGQVLLVAAVLALRGGLVAVFSTIVISQVGVALAYLYLLRRWVQPQRMQTSRGEIKRWLVSWWPFFGFGFFATSARRLDLPILNEMAGQSAAGIYTAATKLLRPLILLRPAIFQAFFPAFVRSHGSARERGLQMAQDGIRVLTTLLSAVVLVASGAAYGIVNFLYQEEFIQSVSVFRILLWAFPPLYTQSLLASTLFADDEEKVVTRIHGFSFAVSVTLHLALAAIWGPVGTAIAYLTVRLITPAQLWIALKRRETRLDLWAIYVRQTLLALVLSLALMLTTNRLHVVFQFLAAALGGTIYLLLAVRFGFLTRREATSVFRAMKALIPIKRPSGVVSHALIMQQRPSNETQASDRRD
jgi:O-antigen/teichoic acid export membrane protein